MMPSSTHFGSAFGGKYRASGFINSLSAIQEVTSASSEEEEEVSDGSEATLNSPKSDTKRSYPRLAPLLSPATLICASILVVALAGLQVLGHESDSSGSKEDWDFPCLCKKIFYRSCPEECKSNHAALSDAPDLASLHEDDHPDHPASRSADISPDFNWVGSTKDLPIGKDAKMLDIKSSSPNVPYVPEDTKKIIRHRKVYVTDKTMDEMSNKVRILNPVRITIPVSVKDEDPQSFLPPPKPYFQLRKYVTYESKPQIQMVPVTKTIIKPVDIEAEALVSLRRQATVGNKSH